MTIIDLSKCQVIYVVYGEHRLNRNRGTYRSEAEECARISLIHYVGVRTPIHGRVSGMSLRV